MINRYIVAIDGPAASGKSTTAKRLAVKLEYVYVDTGAMYRACALCSLNRAIPQEDTPGLAKMLSDISIDIVYREGGNRIILNGDDVSERIREDDISRLSSAIATIGIVRERMVDLQRKLGEKGGIVMDGRDITTVVFPDADFKFFMTADVSVRARRRWLENREKGRESDLQDIERELIWRDKNDSERAHSPLRIADNAIVVDTSDMTIDQQVDHLYKIIGGRV